MSIEYDNEIHEGKLLLKVAELVAGQHLGSIGNLRRVTLREGESLGLHADGRLSDEDVTAVMLVAAPEGGGEFTLKLLPTEGAVLVFPAKADHAVQVITRGKRVAVTGTYSPEAV